MPVNFDTQVVEVLPRKCLRPRVPADEIVTRVVVFGGFELAKQVVPVMQEQAARFLRNVLRHGLRHQVVLRARQEGTKRLNRRLNHGGAGEQRIFSRVFV